MLNNKNNRINRKKMFYLFKTYIHFKTYKINKL